MKGLADRSFKPKYEEEIRTLQARDGRYVVDTQGRKTVASRVLPVPAASNRLSFDENLIAGDARLEEQRREATMPLVRDILARILLQPTPLNTVTKKMTAAQRALVTANKLTTKNEFCSTRTCSH